MFPKVVTPQPIQLVSIHGFPIVLNWFACLIWDEVICLCKHTIAAAKGTLKSVPRFDEGSLNIVSLNQFDWAIQE